MEPVARSGAFYSHFLRKSHETERSRKGSDRRSLKAEFGGEKFFLPSPHDLRSPLDDSTLIKTRHLVT